MSDLFGYSFDPSAGTRLKANINGGVLPPQASEALRVLSLRLPTTLAGSPIGPEGLLGPKLPYAPGPSGGPPPTATPGPVDKQPLPPAGVSPVARPGPVGAQPFPGSPPPPTPFGSPSASSGIGPGAADQLPVLINNILRGSPPPSPSISFTPGQGTQPAVPNVTGQPSTPTPGPAAQGAPLGLLEFMRTLFSGNEVGGPLGRLQ